MKRLAFTDVRYTFFFLSWLFHFYLSLYHTLFLSGFFGGFFTSFYPFPSGVSCVITCKSGARSREGRADTNIFQAFRVPIDIRKVVPFPAFFRSPRSHDSIICECMYLPSSVGTPCIEVDDDYYIRDVLFLLTVDVSSSQRLHGSCEWYSICRTDLGHLRWLSSCVSVIHDLAP